MAASPHSTALLRIQHGAVGRANRLGLTFVTRDGRTVNTLDIPLRREPAPGALWEHEPRLRRGLQEWSDQWVQAQQSLGALSVEVKALLAQPPFAELAGVDADSFVGQAIAELQSAEAPRPHTDGPKASQPLAIARDTLEDRLREQVMFRVRDAHLLDQLHATRDARDQLRDGLEILTLRGRPSGRCELCPFAGATLQ